MFMKHSHNISESKSRTTKLRALKRLKHERHILINITITIIIKITIKKTLGKYLNNI